MRFTGVSYCKAKIRSHHHYSGDDVASRLSIKPKVERTETEKFDFILSEKAMKVNKQQIIQVLNLLMVISSAYMGWKAASLYFNTESPIVVVLS